jgi:hypothetical protein
VQAEPSHWLHETSIPKTVCHHFQPSLFYYKKGERVKVPTWVLVHPDHPEDILIGALQQELDNREE